MYINVKTLGLNINNQMKRTQTNLQKTIQKLSSGIRINSAADDAAGLAIRQKLLALSRGTSMAVRNVQDAVSLVQVADSAMEEITNIIQRIRELTVKAMNGTNTELEHKQQDSLTATDTIIIQNEIDQLKKELNNLVENTEFNQIKLLTNTQPGEYIFENRSAEKNINISKVSKINQVDIKGSSIYYNPLNPVSVTSDKNDVITPLIYNQTAEPQKYIASTVVDYQPQWSEDGKNIVFTSTRDGGSYVVPADGSEAPAFCESINTVSPMDTSSNGLMRLTESESGSNLKLERWDSLSSSWTVLESYVYNGGGYSFSPKVDESGNTSFVFSNVEGNLNKINVNINDLKITGSLELINTNDTLNIPPVNNTIKLTSVPELYRMNTDRASLSIKKVTDSGSRELTYWDEKDPKPEGGYYTISGNEVTFHGDAIIGNEEGDDGQDYYDISLVTDGEQNGIYTTTIPSGAEIYNMHGESGPRSLNISVGGKTISRDQLLESRPEDAGGITGVYVNVATGEIEFYGDLRPAYYEEVSIDYISDTDGRNQIPTYVISTHVDTYNLTDSDLNTNRSLRVYVGDKEIAYDATKTNGYTYDPATGRISLYGDTRPDIPSNEKIRVRYVLDTSETTQDVYGIPLSSKPEVYNLDNSELPHSIRVYRNGKEISYSETDGFKYNESTNTIELYGAARPNVGDKYEVKMVVETKGVSRTDGVVEVHLTYKPETYGIADPSIPSTFRVLVDGKEVNYDANKQNGYFYNSETNRIELYGNALPEAGNPSEPDVEVHYVYESQAVAVGNDSYDFKLSSDTLDYGVESQSEPKAIRVYRGDSEVPYDETNGFTYDRETNILSLHGTYRPNKDDNLADQYRVYYISADDLTATVPQGSYIYKVELNGREIQQTQHPAGNGYFFDGQHVSIAGDARPDITNNTPQISLNVWHSDSFEISLDDSAPGTFFNNYCEHEIGDGLGAEIDPTNLDVHLNGQKLSSDEYTLSGAKVMLNREKLTLDVGNYKLSVNYRVRKPVGYEPNKFTFQVGANSGQSLKVQIESFDNMLRDTDIICVRTHKDAEKGLQVIDKALNFVVGQRGSIGANQNTLDAIASNLMVMEENTISSISRIEDTNMAKEIINQIKNSILSQTTQAMWVHVNQQSENVLQLLK